MRLSGNPSLRHRTVLTPEDRARLGLALDSIFDARGLPRPDHARAVFISLLGQPIPWARAGQRRDGGRFTKPAQAARMETLRGIYREKFQGRGPFPGRFAMVGIFFRETGHVVDGDNLGKLCLDAGNPARRQLKGLRKGAKKPPRDIFCWADDSRCKAKAFFVDVDGARPRTLLAMAELPTPPRAPRRRSAR